jgi:hypothetical protein
MLRSVRRLLLPLLLVAAATPLRAQFIELGGTGCPVTTAPTTSGFPRLGNRISVTCPSCMPTQLSFLVFGPCLTAPYPAFFPPISCTIGPCYVAVSPIATVVPASFSAMIPFDRSLVGLFFCLQCGCISPGVPCLRVWTALRIVIQA